MGAQFGNHSPLPRNAELAEMLRGGATLADLGKRYGVTPATIRGHLNTAGWDVDGNPVGEAARRARLPLFVAPAWMDEALCAQVGGDGFFPEKGGPDEPAENTVSVSQAKRVCEQCPVRRQCLDYALTRRIPDGVWGGTAPRERRRLLKGESIDKPAEPDWSEIREWARDQRIPVADVGLISPKVVEAYRAAHPEAS